MIQQAWTYALTERDTFTIATASTRTAPAFVAEFSLDGELLAADPELTAETVSTWTSEAPRRIAYALEMRANDEAIARAKAFREAEFPIRTQSKTHGGRCSATGRTIAKGTWIGKTSIGWVIADEQSADAMRTLGAYVEYAR